MTSKAGKRARIRSASSGCLSVYSVSDGRSPRRYRSRNASTRSSTGSKPEDASLMAAVLPVRRASAPGPVLSRSRARMIPLAGGGLRNSQHLGDLGAAQLLEVPQRQHLAIERDPCRSRASCTRIFISARIAASLGRVS